MSQKSFSIESKINPFTGAPFGPTYAGTFSIRRPSVQDKINIAHRDAALRNAYGRVEAAQVADGLQSFQYMFIFVSMTATADLPPWFDLAKFYDEHDEAAVTAVWSEVQAFLKSFRPDQTGGTGTAGSEQLPVLVPQEVQAAAP